MSNGEQKSFLNVAEPWILYDTLRVCSIDKDNTKVGWFDTFAAMASKESHSFYKLRTESNVGLAYTNLQATDSLDYRLDVYSFGVSFFAPIEETGQITSLEGIPRYTEHDLGLHGPLWCVDLPRHCGIQLKVQQDIIFEGACYLAPPGYGPLFGGMSTIGPARPPLEPTPPNMLGAATQGVPTISNRWRFPRPIQIPRTGNIEAILWLSDYARYVLGKLVGPWSYTIQAPMGSPPPYAYNFPAACGVQVSMLGKRWVQQRGQYHV